MSYQALVKECCQPCICGKIPKLSEHTIKYTVYKKLRCQGCKTINVEDTSLEKAMLRWNAEIKFQNERAKILEINMNAKPTLDKIYALVIDEYTRACKKHPNWPTDQVHAAAVMIEEAGETMRATLNEHYEAGTKEDTNKEAIQTAAMCIRFLMNRNI